MNDEEARQFIDSQPGATVLDREVMATTKLMEDENIAQTSFYQTLTRLTEHYSDSTHQDEINIQDFLHATHTYADEKESLEAMKIIHSETIRVNQAIARSKALSAYIRQQEQNVLA